MSASPAAILTDRKSADANASPRSFWPMVAILWAAYVIYGIDRSVLLVLLSPIQKEFGLSDSQVGLLSGVGYAVPFALAGIPIGALVDRVNRTRLLAGLLAVWSSFTIVVGLSQNFVVLLASRAMVGASEGGGPPTMLSLIADSVPLRSRPAMMGIFFTGPFVGIFLGSLIAGAVTAHHGWRVALFAAGVPGLVLAAVILLGLTEPGRGAFDRPATTIDKPVSMLAALRFVFADRSRASLAGALIMSALVSIAINSWLSMFLIRVHGLPIGLTGGLSGLILGACGGAGAVSGGIAASRWGAGRPDRVLSFCGGAILLALPLAALAILSHSVVVAVVGLGLWSFLSSSYMGPGYSSLSAVLPPALRGSSMAWIIVLGNLIGAGLGPQIVGSLSDLLQGLGYGDPLRLALAAVTLLSVIPALLFLSVAKSLKD